MRKERVVGWWASDLEMGAWDVEDERMSVFAEELQSPLLYGLLASRHILYRKSECSHILCQATSNPYRGGVVDDWKAWFLMMMRQIVEVGETLVACI